MYRAHERLKINRVRKSKRAGAHESGIVNVFRRGDTADSVARLGPGGKKTKSGTIGKQRPNRGGDGQKKRNKSWKHGGRRSELGKVGGKLGRGYGKGGCIKK